MNKKHAKILGNFLDDMLQISTSKDFPGFFYRSRAHAMVILLITKSHIDEKDVGFEEICEIIPKYISSRTTIKTILDDGIKYNYFKKIKSEIDKRKKIYSPKGEIMNFMYSWIQRNNEIFKNM
tara:strand:- start:345 stop:713 length:369 start_codon:yes stop_codon:yes gene_type:complete